ncbi:opioid growth factor receptor-like isoform X2 [Echeneis naucrates]|uniref:opioid growth factor receptor-like isoform X2 n=1 Tax=Echeneis naucrates TaxID=173247 RepID=UPI001113BA26|nr:opioid growth factor receptor-like isoform X2 [Echeneis naucrates]
MLLRMAWFLCRRVRRLIETLWRLNLTSLYCLCRNVALAGWRLLSALTWEEERDGSEGGEGPEGRSSPGPGPQHGAKDCECQPEAAEGWTEDSDLLTDDENDEEEENCGEEEEEEENCGEEEEEEENCDEDDEESNCEADEDADDDKNGSDSEDVCVPASDELYCVYDSTWEVEEEDGSSVMQARRPATRKQYRFSRFQNAARDMQRYRHDYPGLQFSTRGLQSSFQDMSSDDMPNLEFHLGTRISSPDGQYIKDFHNGWKGNYDALEEVHTFIQWLFPLQEPGVNFYAKELTKEEIKKFLSSRIAKENLLKSYELMLDFYGIELCDKETGEVKRAPNWRHRFCNLNTRTHNNLRITRILKCLGTLGYPHYQAPLVHFFLKETLVNQELPNVKESVLNYFLFAVLDKKERRKLIRFAYLNYEPRDQFVWCPMKFQNQWSALSEGKKTVKRKINVNEHDQSLNSEDGAKIKVIKMVYAESV